MTMVTSIEKDKRAGRLVPVLFTATIFTSALLLFFVQPLFTRMVLPQIGGAAAVWTTAMLFFQTVLIGGYLYAHVLTRHVPTLAQVGIHLALLLGALAFLPLAVPADWQYDPARPVVTQTLWLYALGVGLPFAVLSANAPLIQSWYRKSGGPSAEDPYFLYAASNLGSLVALLAFPLVAEPLFGMTAISQGWSIGFLILGPMLLLSGLSARRGAVSEAPVAEAAGKSAAPTLKTLSYWAFLAFLPSSLMLCVTTRISTDLGSFPLVWVVPLALYLLTFVLVFSTRTPFTADRLQRLLPVVLVVLVLFSMRSTASLGWIALFLVAFFIVGLIAHRRLFDARPDARHLTVFYLTMSVGGALGGLFNSIFAPLFFDRVLEYPITIALIALLLIRRPSSAAPREIVLGLVLSAVALSPLLLAIGPLNAFGISAKIGLAVAILGAILLAFTSRPVVGATAVIAMLGVWLFGGTAKIDLLDRSFFGVHVVNVRNGIREYSNGNTVHGAQLVSETTGKPTPLTYYHPRGLMAQLVTEARKTPAQTIGIIGLGTGALACYAKAGQDWHFYEIDPMVVEIAQNTQYFSFLSNCAPDAKIHVGDARIVLQQQAELKYDILVIDAYSSDAIPMHLATAEAIQLYLDRLNPGGVLVFHVTNRFYDVAQALSVAAAELGLEGRYRSQPAEELEGAKGAYISSVVTLARTREDLGASATDPAWEPLPEAQIKLWTDDYANLLAVLK
jgi:SAM-dependent methyltransferase